MRTSRLAWLLALIAVAAGAWALRDRFRPAAQGGVLLLTLDTLRADYLGCYGSRRARTPHLDALAARGTRFDACASTSPLTLPSHVSLMTGLFPESHGVRFNMYFRYDGPEPTLAEELKRQGHRTGAVIAAEVLGRHAGLARGFDDYDDLERDQAAAEARGLPQGSAVERLADEVTDQALAWLGRHAGPRRFFLWVHYFDPHSTYEPPDEFAERHPDDPYAGEVEFMDQQIGRLLDGVARMGLTDKTLVVAVADHGEGLGDHGEAKHGYFLHQTTIRVPLIVAYPGRVTAGRVVSRPVSIVDIKPMILELVGPGGAGRSLVAEGAPPGQPAYSETLYGRLALGLSRLKSLREGRWKYVRGARAHLFDLDADPGEQQDVVSRHPDVAERLEGRLRTVVQASLASARRPANVDVTEARIAQLQSLGYVAGSAPTLAPEDEMDFSGPAPADEVATIADFEKALTWAFEGNDADAADIFRRLAAKAPWNFGARMQLAQSAMRLGLLDEAERNLEEVLALEPDNPPSLESLAQLDLAAGRLDRALELSDRLLKLHPGTARAWHRKGAALLRLGRLDEAAAALSQAVKVDPFLVGGFELLAQAELRRGRAAAALTPARRAVELMPAFADARATLAAALQRTGDASGARREAEKAIEIDPKLRPALDPILRGAPVEFGPAGWKR
jgi:arylsulfatase A-like enzyme/Tfp pilus assembly protein PilF